MGLDLKLLPFDSSVMPLGDGAWAFSHTVLNCERRRELFQDVLDGTEGLTTPVPENFATYISRENDEETHYGNTQTDPYGEPIQSVPAKALLAFAKHNGVRDNAKNCAVWAYLAELDPETPVALFWS